MRENIPASSNSRNLVHRSGEYHGIVIDVSQKDKSIFKTLDIIGMKKTLFGIISIYKVKVTAEKIDEVIKKLQSNLVDRILFKKQEFYFHFYRDDELIIVFRDNIFRVSPDKSTWADTIAHGRRLMISDQQLDFIPNKFEDEDF